MSDKLSIFGEFVCLCTVMNGKSIKNWRLEDRPREKMLLRGTSALTDAELLAILLRTGSNEKSALDLARELLVSAGDSMRSLSACTLENLTAVKGVGRTKALTLLAAFEAGRRSMDDNFGDERTIASAQDVVEYMRPVVSHLEHEECWMIFLNVKNRVICRERLSSGGVSATVMDIKMVVRRALEKFAAGIILVHNHPSGSQRPGRSDIRNTSELRTAAAALGICLLDHVIIAGKRYFSFGEENFKDCG